MTAGSNTRLGDEAFLSEEIMPGETLTGDILPRAFAPQLHSANASPVCGRGQQSLMDYSAVHLARGSQGALGGRFWVIIIG
jgi:hypothetical protein